jgi:hypothetical protein
MMMAYYSNLMAMTLDLMAYLKNNDGNALRYYLRSAQGRREAINIGGVSSCFDQHFLGF